MTPPLVAGALKVLTQGLYTLVVDAGRPRSRSLGVPVGGAADRWSLAIGNGLVGNPPDAAALEISLTGPALEATCELACVVFGAPFDLQSDRQSLVAGKTFTLQPGEVLRIAGTPLGVRAYLCVRGGLQVAEVLGSRSGLAPLQAGDELPCLPGSIAHRFVRQEDLGSWTARAVYTCRERVTLRVLEGRNLGWFDAEEFFGQDFEVTADSNRMGLRLVGQPLRMRGGEIVSEPVCPGTVQVVRQGQCIILGVDAQTIGGYPRIAQVISADLDRLGQLRWGDQVRFQRVALDEAEVLYSQRQRELRRWLTRLHLAGSL